MAYRDPAAQRAYQRAWHARRKGKKPGKAWRPGGPGRPPEGAKRMEPACKLPGGKMRAEHVFDEDGLCDCGAKRMEFAPRPELRTGLDDGPLLPRALPRAARPEPPAPRPLPVVAKRAAGPPATKQPKTPHSAASPAARTAPALPAVRPEMLIGGYPVSAIVADLEGRRDALDRAIAALRELAGSPA